LSGPVSPGPPGGIPGLTGAYPLPNAAGLLRGTNEQSTTVITFLSFRPGTSFGAQTAGANAYVRWFLSRPDDHVVGVTGPVPAEYGQSQIIGKDIVWVELFTVLAIALIVGVRFRSAGAPLATLACAGTAYVIATRAVVWLAARMGVTLPPDLDPVLVVLLLGVTTDYTVFFLDGMRAQVAGGVPRIRAARLATAEFAPIILAAGIIVAAAAASLVVARTKMLSAFGPGLALTVLTAMAVSMTLGPALMAIFGGLLFRPVPRWLRRQGVTRRESGGRGPGRSPARWNLRTRAARLAAARPMALLIAAAGVAGLLVAAWGAHTIHLGSPLIRELPASASAARAGAAAADGFAPGILSPTEILVSGPGVARQTTALARLQHGLATQPGVAEIAGPASLPGSVPVNPMLAASGGAARFVVVENTDPLDATAISRVQQLRHDLPALARAAGLRGARFELAGQTALTGDSIGSVFADLGRVALAIMAVTLVLLALFLRSRLGLQRLRGGPDLGGGAATACRRRGRRRDAAGLARYHHGRRGAGGELRDARGDTAGAVQADRPRDGARRHPGRDRRPFAAGPGAGGAVRAPRHVAGQPPGQAGARAGGSAAGAGRRSALTGPFQHGQPGPHGHLADPRLVDLELRSLDADHGPPVAERGAQLVLRDPARPPRPRLAVAEAGQVAAATRAQHRRQAGHVPGAALVVEHVEHAAVDDHVEGQSQVRQPEHVTDVEAGYQAPFGRLLPGPPDGEAGHVDADRVGTVGGGQQSLLPRAATGVEHAPG
jgi:hypothetical protein